MASALHFVAAPLEGIREDAFLPTRRAVPGPLTLNSSRPSRSGDLKREHDALPPPSRRCSHTSDLSSHGMNIANATPMPEAQVESKSATKRHPIVAILKSSTNGEFERIVTEHNDVPLPLRATTEALRIELEEVRRLLDELAADRHAVLIFMTGSSVSSLFELADELGRHTDLVRALRTVTTACRGPKAAAVLRNFGLQPTFGERGLFTTSRLMYALGKLRLAGRSVVRFDGVPDDAIANRLLALRAGLREVSICRRRSRSALSAL